MTIAKATALMLSLIFLITTGPAMAQSSGTIGSAPNPVGYSGSGAQPSSAIPTLPKKGYDLYLSAKYKEAEFARFKRQVQSMNDWQNSSQGYQLRMRESEVFEAFRDSCDEQYGLACVDMARLNPQLSSIWLTRGCAMGHRPACRTPAEFAGFAAREDAKAGIFRGQGSPATAEEARLQKLCDRSQWANCLGFSKLAATRLLRNCDLGNYDSCVEYAGNARVYNLAELRPIWGTQRALPAMSRLCSSWTREKGEYETYCGLANQLSAKARYDAQPATSAGTTLAQRQKCLSSSAERVGWGYEKTGGMTRNSRGDVVDEVRSVPVFRSTFQNTCRFPVIGICYSAGNAIQTTLLGNESAPRKCESFYVK